MSSSELFLRNHRSFPHAEEFGFDDGDGQGGRGLARVFDGDTAYSPLRLSVTAVRRESLADRPPPNGQWTSRHRQERYRAGDMEQHGQATVGGRHMPVAVREVLQLVGHRYCRRYNATFVPAQVRPSLTFAEVARILSCSDTTVKEERKTSWLTFAEVERLLSQSNRAEEEQQGADSDEQPLLCRTTSRQELADQGQAHVQEPTDTEGLQEDVSPATSTPPKEDKVANDDDTDHQRRKQQQGEARVTERVNELVFAIKKNVTDDLKQLQKALSAPPPTRRASVTSRLNSGMILKVPVEAKEEEGGQSSPVFRRRAATMAFHGSSINDSSPIADTDDTMSISSVSSVRSGRRTPSDSSSLVNFRSRLNSLLGRHSPRNLAAVYSIDKPARRNTISFAYTVR